jgi:quercetin dioxygenase-like cupin family protein
MMLLSNRLETGSLMPNVIELYGPTETRSHLGEEMVFVLAGKVRVWVGERSFDLSEGEAMTFWSSEPHRYEPAEGSERPARVLSVTVGHPRKR